jgi:hypothetical protein
MKALSLTTLAALTALLALSIYFAACGGDDDSVAAVEDVSTDGSAEADVTNELPDATLDEESSHEASSPATPDEESTEEGSGAPEDGSAGEGSATDGSGSEA